MKTVLSQVVKDSIPLMFISALILTIFALSVDCISLWVIALAPVFGLLWLISFQLYIVFIAFKKQIL
jgi:hypothetical protein